jgi:multiple sugar transport system ATP-binding protein
MARVRLAGVTKRFGPATTAVDALDLDVRDGEFLVLLGPSGCGKSTALRLIAGLERADAGTIEIGDQCVDDVPAEERDVSMVFQSYALYPHMSVRKNIAFSLRPLGTPRDEREREVERVAAQLGLTEVLDRKPGAISGGQQQRVALGRALVRRPSVFLMDEPLSNLDAQLRARTRAELVDLQREIGTTTIYVTHDQVEALTMADRIGVMGAGRLQQLGTPEEVYDRPANTFVAGFVGTPPMNLWPATVADDGIVTVAGTAITDGEVDVPVSGRRDVVVGVRPEALHVVAHGERGLAGVVDWIEDLGHEHLIGGRLAGGAPFALRWAGDGSPPERGDAVHARPDAAALHWFDPDDGARLG